jgi:hypothetical protein
MAWHKMALLAMAAGLLCMSALLNGAEASGESASNSPLLNGAAASGVSASNNSPLFNGTQASEVSARNSWKLINNLHTFCCWTDGSLPSSDS